MVFVSAAARRQMTAKNAIGSARRNNGFRRDSVGFPAGFDGHFFGAIWLFFRAVKIDKAVYIWRDSVGFSGRV